MSEFFLQTESLLSAAADPEYRYLLLEPLIFLGLLTGAVMLVVGHFLKASRLQVSALVVLGVAAMAFFPYKDARLAAQPRIEQVYKSSAPARAKGFADNTAAWVAKSWQFRLLVLAAGVTILIGMQRNRIGFGFGAATFLLGLVAAKNALWLNYQDALAYHPNLTRHSAPIDRRGAGPLPPPSREPALRTPSAPVAQPMEPASRAKAKSSPYPAYPDPGSAIPAPAPPPAPGAPNVPSAQGRVDAPSPPFSKRERSVQPMPRF
jgi:hypothetical protein